MGLRSCDLALWTVHTHNSTTHKTMDPGASLKQGVDAAATAKDRVREWEVLGRFK